MSDLMSAVARFNENAEPRPTEQSLDAEGVSEESSEETEANEIEEATEETPQSETEPETFEVPYNGETQKLTLDELIKGNMMQRDYQFKRGKTAEIEKAAQAKFDEFSSKLKDFEVNLLDDTKWFETEEAKELRDLDPDAYIKRYESTQDKVKKYEDAKRIRDEELSNKEKMRVESERDKLIAALPEWMDLKTQQSESVEAINSLIEFGFSQKEFEKIYDHRMIVMGRELAKMRKIMKQDVSGKKVNKPIKVAEPGSTSTKEQSETKKAKDLRAKLKKSGKMQDALRLLRS